MRPAAGFMSTAMVESAGVILQLVIPKPDVFPVAGHIGARRG